MMTNDMDCILQKRFYSFVSANGVKHRPQHAHKMLLWLSNLICFVAGKYAELNVYSIILTIHSRT